MASTNYRNEDEFGRAEPPRPRSRWTGCLVGCLAVFVILILLAIVGGFWVARNWKNLAATGMATAFKQGVEDSNLPAEEKAELNAEIDRGFDAFRDGRMSNEQFGMLIEKFINSPLMTTLVASAAEKNYIDKSGLSDEERAEARVTLRRFVRGSMDGDIDRQSMDSAMKHIADKQPDGNWSLREKVSDEELRAFLAEAKKLADEAKVPEQAAEIDPSDEVKRIIDETMAGPAAMPKQPEKPEQPPEPEEPVAPPTQ